MVLSRRLSSIYWNLRENIHIPMMALIELVDREIQNLKRQALCLPVQLFCSLETILRVVVKPFNLFFRSLRSLYVYPSTNVTFVCLDAADG